jgi:hypothetical protein
MGEAEYIKLREFFDAALRRAKAARVRGETLKEAADKMVRLYGGYAATHHAFNLGAFLDWCSKADHLPDASKKFDPVIRVTEIDTPKPTWSTARPTECGWYWWRRDLLAELFAYRLYESKYGLMVALPHEPDRLASDMDGEWCPIAVPVD